MTEFSEIAGQENMPLTTLDPQTALIVVDLQKALSIGVATGTGVESTARQAYEQGFSVTLGIDDMTDVGKTATTQDIIDLLGQRSA